MTMAIASKGHEARYRLNWQPCLAAEHRMPYISCRISSLDQTQWHSFDAIAQLFSVTEHHAAWNHKQIASLTANLPKRPLVTNFASNSEWVKVAPRTTHSQDPVHLTNYSKQCSCFGHAHNSIAYILRISGSNF